MAKTYKVIIKKIESETVQKKLAMALSKLTKKSPQKMFVLVKRAPTVLFKSIPKEKADFLSKKFGKTLEIIENEPDIPEVAIAPEPEIEVTEPEHHDEEIEVKPPEMPEISLDSIESPSIEEPQDNESEEEGLGGLDITSLGLDDVTSAEDEPQGDEIGGISIDLSPLPEDEPEEEISETPSIDGLGIGMMGDEGIGIEVEEDDNDVVEDEMSGAPMMPSFEPEEEEEEEIEEEEAPTVSCPNCDSPNIEGTRYCEICGFDLTKVPQKKGEDPDEDYPEEDEEIEEELLNEPEKHKNKSSPVGVFILVTLIAILGAVGYFWAYPAYYLMRGVTYVTKDTPELRGRHPQLSPDGTQLAFIGIEENSIFSAWIYSLENPNLRLELNRLENGTIDNLLWSPNGDMLLMESTEETQAKDGEFYDIPVLSLIDINEKHLEKIAYYVCNSAWRTDGAVISYYSQNTKKIEMYNIETGETETIMNGGSCLGTQWISDTTLITSIDNVLQVIDIENPKASITIDKIKKTMWTTSPAPILSQDKHKVLYAKEENLMVYDLNKQESRVLAKGLTEKGNIRTDMIEPGCGAAWLPGNNKVIYTDCIDEDGYHPGTFKIVTLSGASLDFTLKNKKINLMGEPSVVGNKVAFCGQHYKEGVINPKGMGLESIFIVDLRKAGILP